MGRVPLSDEEREPGSVDDGRAVRESGDAWWVNLTCPVVSCVRVIELCIFIVVYSPRHY